MSPQLPGIFQDQLSDFQSQIEQNQRAITEARMQAAQAGELSGKQLAAAALTTLLPIAIGGALAGRYGVQAGGQAGSAGLQAFDTITSQRNQRQQQLAEAQAKMLEQENRQLSRDAQSLQRQGALATFNQGEANARAAASLAERRSRPSLTGAINNLAVAFGKGQKGGESDASQGDITNVAQFDATDSDSGEMVIRVPVGTDPVKAAQDVYERLQQAGIPGLPGTEIVKKGLEVETKGAQLTNEQLESQKRQMDLESEKAKRELNSIYRDTPGAVRVPTFSSDGTLQEIAPTTFSFDDTPSSRLNEAKNFAAAASNALNALSDYAQVVSTGNIYSRAFTDSEELQSRKKDLASTMVQLSNALVPGGKDSNVEFLRQEAIINMSPEKLMTNIAKALGAPATLTGSFEDQLKVVTDITLRKIESKADNLSIKMQGALRTQLKEGESIVALRNKETGEIANWIRSADGKSFTRIKR